MLASVPTEILTGGFAIIGTLTAYVWNAQSKSISELKRKINDKPCLTVCSHIEAIRVDIDWIKRTLKK